MAQAYEAARLPASWEKVFEEQTRFTALGTTVDSETGVVGVDIHKRLQVA